MPKKSERKYGNYYRKRVKMADGSYKDVYGKTIAERDEKVERLKREESVQLAAQAELNGVIYASEYIAGWYKLRSPHMSKQWASASKRYINYVICPVIGAKDIRKVTSDDLAAVMSQIAGKSRSYQKSVVQLLKQIFGAALNAEVIDRDPSRTLKAGGRPPAKKQALTVQQQETLLDAVKGLKAETFCLLALYTGMRREEILGLQWDCVELDGVAPYVSVERACRWPGNTQAEISRDLKTPAAYRTIPIPPQLRDHLAALSAAEKLKPEKKRQMTVLHGKNGGPLSYSAFRSLWNAIEVRSTASGRELGEKVKNHKYCVSIDFPVAPHILRHTYITRMILGGVSLKRVQYLAGHADPQVTIAIYTDLMGHAPEDLIGDVLSVFAPSAAPDGSKNDTP